jgi:YggT family protein
VDTICFLLNLYILVIIVRMVLSWVPITPDTPMATIYSAVYRATEPVLGPLRRAIPPMRMGAGALDVSPLIVIIGVYLICRL